MDQSLTRFIPVAIPVLLLTFMLIRSRSHRLRATKAKNLLISRYIGQTVFFCDACEDLGKDLVQFYGDPSGGPICSGDLLTLPNGQQFPIIEVYGADDTPDKPDPQITPGMTACAIVINSPNFDFSYINQIHKTESVAVFKITSAKN